MQNEIGFVHGVHAFSSLPAFAKTPPVLIGTKCRSAVSDRLRSRFASAAHGSSGGSTNEFETAALPDTGFGCQLVRFAYVAVSGATWPIRFSQLSMQNLHNAAI
jgi:hypothetical protein